MLLRARFEGLVVQPYCERDALKVLFSGHLLFYCQAQYFSYPFPFIVLANKCRNCNS